MLATGTPILDRGGFFAKLDRKPILLHVIRRSGAHHPGDVSVGRRAAAIRALCTLIDR
ncbi:putative iron-sulfur binding oxidoreductase domain protein [Mycobacteroides abscessus subsp. massiliense CCUG 48898 = JCM 15300]|nr:hypothetical protein MMAS_23240 [Mycobacteroides abscessus subsp. massiliense CCUG 48898 = JCM 15300]EIV63538.1 putative iron-sulfur binding oxidoreductase domain protein [Mycobacteroides abscessus subsp. massiliense CCUG 48898 = JCM 15300]BAP97226.1 hypothetical protein MMASJCM_2450 [Mycobacteroides abscessus subsp. massiliense CCUG 48898 = JCM 15300]